MNISQAVLLGALQGITEFLPVSSSGHLALARAVMEIEEIPVLFDVILHIATLVVIIWTFRVRIGNIFVALWHSLLRSPTPEDRMQLNYILRLIEASAITAVVGLAVFNLDVRENPVLIAVLMIVTAMILLATLWANKTRRIDDIGRIHSIIIGGTQGLGILPGMSRSGITIGTGLLLGLDRKSAGEFSFLLSIPATFGALLISLKDVGSLRVIVPFPSILTGFFIALLTGYVFLRLLLWLVADGKLWIFTFYLIPVGTWALVHFM